MTVYRRRRWTAALLAILALFAAVKLVSAVGDDPGSPASPTNSGPAEPDPADAEPPPIERERAGRGVRGAEVVRQQGSEGGPLVILLHGWLVAERSDYRAWAVHLARQGVTVILPKYQNSTTSPDAVLANARRGVENALGLVGEPSSVIAVGHSAGAALAADYAASAPSNGLPVPDAVLAIYPGRAILGYPAGIPLVDPAGIQADTRLVVMSSPRDQVVGEQPAQELFAGATSVPDRRKRLISVGSVGAGDHYAPAGDSPAARRTFWRELDRLVARVEQE